MVRPTQFKIERTPASNGTHSLAVMGELDIATTPQLEEEVNKALAEGATTILIDMADLSFIDSTGLRLFIQLNEQALSDGWRLTMASPSEQVRTILLITGAGSELPIVQEKQAP